MKNTLYFKTPFLIPFLCALCLVLNGCYDQERNCAKFKTGTFEFETLLNGALVKTTFVRNDTLEIDYFRGKADSASIRWINDCEYIVKKLHPNNRSETKAVHMKILTTHEDSYTFEYAIIGKSNKQQGTATKTGTATTLQPTDTF